MRAQLEAEGVVFPLALDGGVRHVGDLDSVPAFNEVLVRLASGISMRASRELQLAPSIGRAENEDVRLGGQARGLANNFPRRWVSQTDPRRCGDWEVRQCSVP
ncbi:MAG: hypothetical protein KUG77_25755 [Nannocystaceae bacterium]|nr:hypothetical protein [Nannocystaceae bacterium]